MVPVNFIYAYLGSLITNIAELFSSKQSTSEYILLGVGLVVTIRKKQIPSILFSLMFPFFNT